MDSMTEPVVTMIGNQHKGRRRIEIHLEKVISFVLCC